jgi:hypothetical protein
MTAPKIKPCPFCGGDVIYTAGYGVSCTKCSARMPCTLHKIEAEWNTRTASIPALGDDYVEWRKTLEDIADGMGESSLEEIGRFAPAVARAALSARPTDTRVVTVAQLERFARVAAELGDVVVNMRNQRHYWRPSQ